MKIKKGFLLRKLGSEYVAVASGRARRDFNGLIRMNDTGKFLWERLETGCSPDELVQCMRTEYEVEEAEARADAAAFTERLRQAGILE